MTKKEKFEELKKFLIENKVKFRENVVLKHCKSEVKAALLVKPYNIAVHVSNEQDAAFYDSTKRKYKPFFIRENESKDFIIEKMKNCIIDRMRSLHNIHQRNLTKRFIK